MLILLVLWSSSSRACTGTGRTVLSRVHRRSVIIGAVIFALPLLAVADRGLPRHQPAAAQGHRDLNKHSADSSLEKINDAILFENLLGRMLNYGDLDILTAAEVAVDRYHMLHHAKAFKKTMLNAKHTLEHEVAYVEMPSPPIRTDTPAGTTVPLPAASAAMDTRSSHRPPRPSRQPQHPRPPHRRSAATGRSGAPASGGARPAPRPRDGTLRPRRGRDVRRSRAPTRSTRPTR